MFLCWVNCWWFSNEHMHGNYVKEVYAETYSSDPEKSSWYPPRWLLYWLHGYQNWYEQVDIKRGYNHTKFEWPRAQEKSNVTVFVKSGNNCQLDPLKYMPK